MRPVACLAALRCGILWVALLFAPPASRAADSSAAGPWATLELKGGRILHNVKVISDEGESLVVRADEGLIKVAKADLPPPAVEAYPAKPAAAATPAMVMIPFNPDLPPVAPPPPTPRPSPKPAPKAKPAPNPVFKGCTIASFQVKPFQNSLGTAEVVIENATDAPAVIFPGDIACLTASGARHVGRQIVTDGFPPIIKRRQIVPPQGSIDIMVTFTTETLDISGVQWSR